MLRLPFVLLVACSAPSVPEPTYHTLAGEAFGTTWHLTWTGPAPAEVGPEVTATLERVDARMSSWRRDSELSQVRGNLDPVVVSEETAEVVQAALDLAEITGGAFDPTVEPLMEVWGFRGGRLEAVPSNAEVEAARDAVGFDKVVVFRHGDVPLVQGGGTSLDLSAIAKGHAVDAVSHTLSRLGASDQLVEIGGEVRVTGHGPKGAWMLSVDAPDPDAGPGAASVGTLAVHNVSIASSGDYRTAYEVDGQRVAHTMDPRTGRPVVSEVLAATVVAPDCRSADGWATALMVLPYEQGRAFIDARPELDAMWVVGDGEDHRVEWTDGMKDWTAESR